MYTHTQKIKQKHTLIILVQHLLEINQEKRCFKI